MKIISCFFALLLCAFSCSQSARAGVCVVQTDEQIATEAYDRVGKNMSYVQGLAFEILVRNHLNCTTSMQCKLHSSITAGKADLLCFDADTAGRIEYQAKAGVSNGHIRDVCQDISSKKYSHTRLIMPTTTMKLVEQKCGPELSKLRKSGMVDDVGIDIDPVLRIKNIVSSRIQAAANDGIASSTRGAIRSAGLEVPPSRALTSYSGRLKGLGIGAVRRAVPVVVVLQIMKDFIETGRAYDECGLKRVDVVMERVLEPATKQINKLQDAVGYLYRLEESTGTMDLQFTYDVIRNAHKTGEYQGLFGPEFSIFWMQTISCAGCDIVMEAGGPLHSLEYIYDAVNERADKGIEYLMVKFYHGTALERGVTRSATWINEQAADACSAIAKSLK